MIVAVIDTNVWVSAFLHPSGFPARLIQAGKSGHFLIVSSWPLLDELREVLMRPRLMKIRHSTAMDVNAFVAGVGAVVRLISIVGELRLVATLTMISSWKRRFREGRLIWSVAMRT